MSRRTPHTRIGSAVLALAAGAALLTAAPAGATDEALKYVALGDSFVSGPLIPNQVNAPCGRSDHNYPHLAAAAVGATLTDVSCGGARIQDMTGSQLPGTAPQFDALKPDTDIVTVGIGGNDLPFGEVVLVCGGLGVVQPFGRPCTNYYNRGGVDELARRMTTTLEPRLTEVVEAIKERSPNARVLFVGVPSVLPESGSCWGVNIPIAPGDYPYLVKVTKDLNRTFATAAANAGGEFVDMYQNSLGHDVCKRIGVRWVEGIIPGSAAAPAHPNLLGMEGAAEVVAAAIAAG